MKKSQIKVGGLYKASVNGKIVTVRVDEIKDSNIYGPVKTSYDVTNMSTGRRTSFRSASKFREEVTVAQAEEGLRTDPLGQLIAAANPALADPTPASPSRGGTGQTPSPKKEDDAPSSTSETDSMSTLRAGDTVYIDGNQWTVHSIVGQRANLLDGQGRLRPGVCVDSCSLTSPTFGVPTEADVKEVFAPVRNAPASPSTALSRFRQNAATAAKVEHKSGSHVIVRARAGTGKTTTAVEGIKNMLGRPVKIQPSPQQQAVWDALAESKECRSIALVAFNAPIAAELERKVEGLPGVSAMTMHKLGYAAVRQAFGRLRDPNKFRTDDIIEELTGTNIRTLRKERQGFITAVKDLVSYCKQTLTEGKDTDGLDRLCRHFLVEIQDKERVEVYDMVALVLDRSKDVRKDGAIDFDDMIWLPIVLNLPIQKYDLLIVDEAQDLNAARQELAMRAGRRIVLIGDDRQAIYGFTGADVEGLDTMHRRLSATPSGCVLLPLTVTRRCGKAIVEEARKEVEDFEAHESNGDGKISEARYPIQGGSGSRPRIELPYEETYMPLVNAGDMILCRVNAPLVSQCFRFLKRGRKAYIQGRDIGEGIVKMIEGFKAKDVPDLVSKISEWLDEETRKENAKKNPNDTKLIAMEDKASCLMCFCEGERTVESVTDKVRTIFTDKGEGIRLSSIHKAKGLEADRVFLLQIEGGSVPHPMAKSKWQVGQEHNLLYVAITRAINELVYVS